MSPDIASNESRRAHRGFLPYTFPMQNRDFMPLTGRKEHMDSSDLQRLMRLISGRIHVYCGQCKNMNRLTVEAKELRMGSSPDMSQIDPTQPGRPRLIFYCGGCRKKIGFVQGDDWVTDETQRDDEADPTRFNRLELK